MRLARPVYESLPLFYMLIGALAIVIFYLDPAGLGGKMAFTIGFLIEIAALTLFLRRADCRALSQDYSGQAIELPTALDRNFS